jgi:hypothetical protein
MKDFLGPIHFKVGLKVEVSAQNKLSEVKWTEEDEADQVIDHFYATNPTYSN